MGGKRIRGEIIHYCRDEYGEIFVADDGRMRSLYFGDGISQSSIRLDRPEILVDDYSHAMMSALLFKSDPGSVLLVGMGGCSLVHFIRAAFPGCTVDIVELRNKVIDLAHDFFHLPREAPGIRIFHAAGEDFIGQQSGADRYDLILVDAFDHGGPAAALLEVDFLAACRGRLNEKGIFSINLWNRPQDNFPMIHLRLQEAFMNNTLKLLLSESAQNAIVFGFDRPVRLRDLSGYRQKARTLQDRHAINFPKYLKHIYWQNYG
ncbi:MAG: fused MFS/spermidine synthase [Nitrospiraceae bacterium]|nr:fused MFS/spermidine synthase [Nitrospiraceae bacterium]